MTSSRRSPLPVLAALAFTLLLLLAGRDVFYGVPASGALLGRLSLKWAAGLGLVALVFTVLGLLAWLTALAPRRLEGVFARLMARLTALRGRLGLGRWLLAAIIAPLPGALLLFTPLGVWLGGDYARLLALLLAAAVTGFLFAGDDSSLLPLPCFLAGLVAVAAAHLSLERFSSVSAFPFSLTWSEGNRLLDYALAVNPARFPILDPENLRGGGVGRSWLWGLPFLLPHTTIALHRAWDGLLWTVPYLALGAVFARLSGARRAAAWLLAGWVFIFLFQGPIYTPLVLCALLIGLAALSRRWWVVLPAVLLAGYYAAASRWTWLAAPAAWAVILMLDQAAPALVRELPSLRSLLRPAAWRPLLPIAVVAALGLAGGMLADDRLFSPEKLKTSTALSQPLLWYRLLPNVNYPEGLLLGLALAALPVVVLLIWLAATRRWPLHWLQSLAYAVAALVFLGGGVVASVKIGGGNNLHNLDMFLITLALLGLLAWKAGSLRGWPTWPAWATAVLLLVCLLPAWSAVQIGKPLALPTPAETEAGLQAIQTRVAKASKRGEVLFIDQRQLFAFGQIENLPLMVAYEKKYLMDKAMAGNADYFAAFYADLRAQRFSLIVTEPLFANVQDMQNGFREENNAWVQWVAQPLLCYYAPVDTLNEVRTQMLVPRQSTEGCP